MGMHPYPFGLSLPWLYALILLPFGGCVGSFLNVVAYRWVYERSLIRPGSTCWSCGKAIALWDNIPVISWLLLRGRCRSCQASIHWRYVATEAFAALLFAMTGYVFATVQYGVGHGVYTGMLLNAGMMTARLLFVSVLLAILIIDFDWRIIPDRLSLGGTLGALAVALLLPQLHGIQPAVTATPNPRLEALLAGIVGALVGAGVMVALTLIGTLAMGGVLARVRETEDAEADTAMGWGDSKLMALIGAFLGWQGALAGFLIGAFLGAIYGGVQKFRTGRPPEPRPGEAAPGPLRSLSHRWATGQSMMPFGPFLALGAIILMLWREPILETFAWYLRPMQMLWGF